MSSHASTSGHKRKRSTQITDFYTVQKKTKAHHRKRSSTSHTTQHTLQGTRNTALPTNRIRFHKNFSYRSTIPKGIKQNPHHRNYYGIPNNKRYASGQITRKSHTMSTTTGQGHVKGAQDLENKTEESKRYYETRTVMPRNIAVKNHKGQVVRAEEWNRSRIKITMRKEQTWPTYTFNTTSMYWTPVGHLYSVNMGYRHKPVIRINKFTTTLIVKSTSDQPWKMRTIVWTHDDQVLFNRASSVTGQRVSGEMELLTNVGWLTPGHNRQAKIEWQETFYSADGTPTETPRSIDYLIEAPLNTKYPSECFYWGTTSAVGVLYDAITSIPGKTNFLDSEMFKLDTWQMGPGTIEYNDIRARGGDIQTHHTKVKHRKNTYITFFFEPEGKFSGEPLLATDSEDNSLEIDIIHTIHWDE